LLLTVPAGQLVDRVDRRGVLAASLAVQACVALVLAWGSYGEWVGRDLIFALCVAMGVARALQMPSQQALVPALVPMAQLPRAFALSSTLLKFAVIGGPALGGFIYAPGPDGGLWRVLRAAGRSTAFVARCACRSRWRWSP
jgi:MFS family permease